MNYELLFIAWGIRTKRLPLEGREALKRGNGVAPLAERREAGDEGSSAAGRYRNGAAVISHGEAIYRNALQRIISLPRRGNIA